MKFFTQNRALRLAFLSLIFLTIGIQDIIAQACNPCWGLYPMVKQRRVANANVSPWINGYLELLPPGYNPNSSTRYPLIISFPGRGTKGGGTLGELCSVACEGLAFKIEQDMPTGSGNYRFATTVTQNGQSYSYIILTPQVKWGDGESASDVSAMVNYALANYRVDPARVYLTGLSSSANMVVNYMGSSVQNARKIAAVISVGLCMGANTAAASFMGTNSIHYWGLVGSSDNQCGTGNTINQSNQVNSYSPPGNPRGKYTLVNGVNVDPHVIWPEIHDIDWRVDGKNMSEWFIQFSPTGGSSLPATLDAYNVSSRNKQVITEWATTAESNTDYFSIERAGADLQFEEIGRVTAAGNSTTRNSYSFADAQPLKGTGFYRLSLVNRDGVREYYDIKKISNKFFGAAISVSPVPANKTLQLSFELEESQKLNFIIRDINGRNLKTWSANFSSGYASMPINIEALTAGVYYLSLQGSSFTEVKKFIKQ